MGRSALRWIRNDEPAPVVGLTGDAASVFGDRKAEIRNRAKPGGDLDYHYLTLDEVWDFIKGTAVTISDGG